VPHRFVAREVRLLLRADGIDVSGLDERRESHLELASALQKLEDDESSALRTSLLDDAVEGVKPFARLTRVDVGQLVLELVEDLMHPDVWYRPTAPASPPAMALTPFPAYFSLAEAYDGNRSSDPIHHSAAD
jgi:hypothetical protein